MKNAVAANIAAYTRRATRYDALHPEIFNEHEQRRLREVLARAADEIRSGGRRALDYGCGSGNLTAHLCALGFDVTAADVTPKFLRIVEQRYGVPTVELVGGSLASLPDDHFDLIAMYSVLHHIHDYLAALRGLVGKLAPGGVLVVEHEANEARYFPPAELIAFRAENYEATRGGAWDPEHKRWQHLLRAATVPSRYVGRYRRRRRITAEGDIHVHADDHIEWDELIGTVRAADAEIVERTDFLAFVGGYDDATWLKWRGRCSDQTSLIARRRL